jgi:hypothetical protein
MKKRQFWGSFILSLLLLFLTADLTFAQAGNYPQLDISGFKKWEYKKADVSPNKNYFSGLTQLGGFYPTFTGGPWQERLQLRILGQLSENLAVTYDLEQQPETPDRYDVKVKYYNSELTFGDFTANFSGNEFASTSKFLNGVMLTAKENWYDITAVPSSKLKSQTQNLTSQNGNNTKGPYNIGHGSIVEGSERITLNDLSQVRNVDYTIDYFEGKITFNKILSSTDIIKYTYEYTNVLDLFFPTLSKRDFFGLQGRLTLNPEEFGRPTPKEESIVNSAYETFPTTGSIEPEVIEQESSGLFQLKHSPVVNFSEKLTFMGTELKKNEDYIIRYEQGDVRLLTRFLPTSLEALTVNYQYYETSKESEVVPGIGSRGPYQLSHSGLVAESERIEVDSKVLVRDLDYKIHYDSGVLMFGNVLGPTSQIKAAYTHIVKALPQQQGSKFPRELKVGATYLRESAKKSAGTATASLIESITGQTAISNKYHLYLKNRPIVSTTEGVTFIVKVDGVELTPEVDYAIPKTYLDSQGFVHTTPEAILAYINDQTDPSDGLYTGTIKIINPNTITATSQVTVTYTYKKSVVGKYSGLGDGTRGPFYLRNVRNVVPGSETVQVWDQGSSVITTYTRNSSFEPDARTNGYSINYNSDNPSIYFNDSLVNTKNFQIIYQYIPPTVNQGGDIAQSVTGLDGSFKIGDVFKVETAYARSDTDQVYISETTVKTFPGNGSKSYSLGSSKDLVESSEKVYVNNNLLNKDIDYFASYTTPGQISFYYIAPATADVIVVEYQYLTQEGSSVDQKVKTDFAYKLAAETKIFGDTLKINGNTKHVGFDFTPQGGTSVALGANYKEYNVIYNPNVQGFVTNYSYKENDNPLNNSRERFLRSFDNSVAASVNPGKIIKLDIGFRDYKTLDDLTSSIKTHSNDTVQDSYNISLTPSDWSRGILTLTQKYDYKKTTAQNDALRDSLAFSQSDTEYKHANAGLKLSDRFGLGFDYQYNEPKTTGLKTVSGEATVEALSTLSRAIDTSYDLNLDLTFNRIEKWTARINLIDHKGETLVANFNPTDEVNVTKNETYHMDFVPITMLSAALDHNRQERTTFVVGGLNPRSERTAANVRLAPYNWLAGAWSGSQSESVPETGAAFKTTGRANTYTANYTPFDRERFKLGANFTLADNNQTAPSGTLEGILTQTNSFMQNYTSTIAPITAIPITLGLAIENYRNRNNNPLPVSQVDTETQNQTSTAGLSFTPFPALTLSANYNVKTTMIIRDLRVSSEARTKTVLDSKATYLIASWGTLVYDREDENNGGEVQAGSVADLDLKKTTETYSLNITLPVDNPVLSSFVFIASQKIVAYENHKNSADNFRATQTTFEGSLNF